MAEALFYHLERASLDAVLPGLLERTLDRGWRAIVRAGSPERLAALDTLLWTYSEESFLPHGTAADGPLSRQPVALTVDDGNPNGAQVLFCVDGADPGWTLPEIAQLTRVVLMFDGNDPAAVAGARVHWAAAKAAGYATTYWRQSSSGRWEKQA